MTMLDGQKSPYMYLRDVRWIKLKTSASFFIQRGETKEKNKTFMYDLTHCMWLHAYAGIGVSGSQRSM